MNEPLDARRSVVQQLEQDLMQLADRGGLRVLVR